MKKTSKNNMFFIMFLVGIFLFVFAINCVMDVFDFKFDDKYNLYSYRKSDWLYSKIKKSSEMKYDRVQIGSSTSAYWLDMGKWQVANIMSLGISYEKIYDIFEVFYGLHPEVKTVFLPLEYATILLDYYPINDLPKFDGKPYLSFSEFVNYYFSAEITYLSFETAKGKILGSLQSSDANSDSDANNEVMVAATRRVSYDGLVNEKKFQNDIAYIEKFIDLLQHKNIEIICYIAPMNYVQLQGIMSAENFRRVEEMKAKIIAKGVPIYDFSFANKYNVEKMTDTLMFFDVVHPDILYGNMAFEAILGQKKSDLYKLITKDNLKETNSLFRQGIEDYRKNYKDYIKEYTNYDEKAQSKDFQNIVYKKIPENLMKYNF